MIVEFALSLSLSLPVAGPTVTLVEFTEPVQQVITYPPDAVLNQLSGLTLPDGTIQAFEDGFLVEDTFFGAFAITKDFGYGYVTGSNSIEAAREVAIQECLKQGPVCMIYAELLPNGYVPLAQGQVALSPEAANHFNNPNPDWGNYRAMAISEDGAYSVVWNYGSPREASEAALSDCTGYRVDDLPNLRDMPCVLIPFK
ncbi:hypothetical protein SAMN05444287_2297 [Octadecabacter temperatus]|uniref:Uncharacterized protein n=1 Tax=Octadecabacter temperatus TaxID=1458307 RepID=A0A0K0Y1G9_9RHOB|nr:hypothetical protein [Octadecabacter temperatus]AKS44789.1 hypothetical protein OSB_02200 [Octadecabacter temperatus]SIO35238.1 hypothetical protein SAMN05444287_2297 [Octadecabacter temperatus]